MNIVVNYIDAIRKYLNRGPKRSVSARKNILASTFFKGIDIVLGFAVLPLALRYLGPVQFGLFTTLISIAYWFAYFDIGLSHGLRNKFAEALAAEDNRLARIYVSTAYYFLGIIFSIIFIVFLIVNNFLDWSKILNASSELKYDLKLLSIIVFAAFSLRFVFGLINSIFYALQKSAMVDVFNVLGKMFWIIVILVLISASKSSILYFGAAYSLIFALVPILGGIYCYNVRYQKYAPSFKFVESKYAKKLVGLGAKFFIIQISLVVIQSTNNLLITQFVGPASVTAYNIAFKYFSLAAMLFTIINTPLWSAYTEAYKKNDMQWIKDTLRTTIKIWGFMVVLVLVMVFISNSVYKVWIGTSISIPFLVSVLVGLLMLVNSWNSIFLFFINGTSKIRLQMYLTIAAGIINIPLSIFFIKYFDMGSAGVVLGSVICLIASAIFAPIQAIKIIQRKDFGIWGA
jgi:O-antigen/teichoic acid export membrane protein